MVCVERVTVLPEMAVPTTTDKVSEYETGQTPDVTLLRYQRLEPTTPEKV